MTLARFCSRALIISLPATILGHYVGGKLVVPALAMSAILAATATSDHFLSSRRRGNGMPAWGVVFTLFLAVGIVSVAISPYSDQILSKAAFQVLGIGTTLAASLALAANARSRPRELASLTRLLSITMAVLAGVGIVQFLTSNLLGREVVSFRWMNEVAGGQVWASPDKAGPLFRSNSFCLEPSHYGLMLGLAAGPALFRVGLCGADFRRALRPWVPGSAAVVVLVGMLMSLSLVAYFNLLATAAAAAWMFRRQALRRTLRVALALAILVGGLVALTVSIVPELGLKLTTVNALGLPFGGKLGPGSVRDLSARTLAANMEVAQANLRSNVFLGGGLGSHPVAYARTMPGYAVMNLNSQDGASLLVRLLSETGLLGAACFIWGCALVIARARRSLAAGSRLGPDPTGVRVCAMAVTASFVGTFIAYLARMGTYYHPAFWTILGLTAGAAFAPGRLTSLPLAETGEPQPIKLAS